MIPPGIEGSWQTFVQGGSASDWLPFESEKQYTNAYVVCDGKILLGYKKRGFGKGKYNGFGGKVDPNETIQDAAARELEEEAGISAPLEQIGNFLFVMDGVGVAFQISIFRASEYVGQIEETEEMKPEWFPINKIPYDKMWETDVHWLSLIIDNKNFAARTDVKMGDADTSVPLRWWAGTEEKTAQS